MTEQQAKHTQPPAGLSISPHMQAYLDTQVEAGEQVLWAGTTNMPGRMKRLRPFVIMCLFMMFFCSGLFLHGFLDIAQVEQVADLMRRTFPGAAGSEQ